MDRRKVWRLVWFSALGLAALYAGFYFFIDLSSKVALEKSYTRLRAAGLAVTAEEFRSKFPRVKREENALSSMVKVNSLPRTSRTISFSTPLKKVAIEEPIFDKHIQLVDEVLAKPKVDFSNFWQFNLQMASSSDYAGLQLSESLLGKAALEYSRGRRLSALRLILKDIKISQIYLKDPRSESLKTVLYIQRSCMRQLIPIASIPLSRDEFQIIEQMRLALGEPSNFSFYFSQTPIFAQNGFESMKYDASRSQSLERWRFHLRVALSTPGQMKLEKTRILNEIASYAELEKEAQSSLEDLRTEVLKLDNKYTSHDDSEINSVAKEYFTSKFVGLVDSLMYIETIRNVFDAALGRKTEKDFFSGYLLKKRVVKQIEYIYSIGIDRVDDGGSSTLDITLPKFKTQE